MSSRRRVLASPARAGLGAGLCAGLVLAVAVADGHVRMRTPDGVPLAWRGGCPGFTIAVAGGDAVTTADVVGAFAAARDAWQGGGDGCPGLPIDVVARDAPAGVAYDGTDRVLWRAADHCDDASHQLDEVCLSPNAAAVTTVFFHDRGDRAGEIVETDVELNGAFAFGLGGEVDRIDLRSVVTHELGHAVGLEHTCELVPGRAPLADSDGVAIPPCSPQAGVPAAARDATMYPYAVPGDLAARTPLADERAGVCALYRDHGDRCADTGPGCGCGTTPGPATTGPGAAALALVVGAALRRRRRPPSRATATGYASGPRSSSGARPA